MEGEGEEEKGSGVNRKQNGAEMKLERRYGEANGYRWIDIY